MKRTLIIFLCLISLTAMAQDTKVIGGYLLDGQDSLEELDASVLVEYRSKKKVLTGKGMRIAGAVIKMSDESKGMELGSIVETKHPFLVRTISFTVLENKMDKCRADIRIYRIAEDGTLEDIVTMPVFQDIPKVSETTTFTIAPEERIVLDPGEYYVSFSLSETGTEYILFPLFVKGSYIRESPSSPLKKMGVNIGISVRGLERK